jgi:YbbR domain-containing protein
VLSKLRWMGNIFRENWPLKLLAIGLAIMTYYAIRGAISFEVPIDVPIEIRVEPGIAILDQDTRSVRATFQGSQDDLSRLDQQQLRAVIRPKVTNPSGSEVVPITERNIQGAPGSSRVVKVLPSQVTLTFDREDSRKVAVLRPKTMGTPLAGKVEIDYEPREVTIIGPKRRLADKEAVSTEPVDVDGRVESFTKRVKVLPPADTWVSQIEPSEISVHVNIVTETVARELDAVPVLTVARPEGIGGVDLDPPAVKATLYGRAEELDLVTAQDVRVFVDCTNLDPSANSERPVQVHLPAGVELTTTVVPETVKVTFHGH